MSNNKKLDSYGAEIFKISSIRGLSTALPYVLGSIIFRNISNDLLKVFIILFVWISVFLVAYIISQPLQDYVDDNKHGKGLRNMIFGMILITGILMLLSFNIIEGLNG